MIKNVVKVLVSRGYEADVKTVVKNGVEMVAVVIGTPESNVKPCIYWNEAFNTLDAVTVADEIEKQYKQNNDFTLDTKSILDPAFLMEHCKICIQRRSNEDIVKHEFLDLEIYIRCYITNEHSFKITKPVLDIVPDIWDKAIANTENTFTATSMLDLMAEMMHMSIDEIIENMPGIDDDENKQIVVTNIDKTEGASCLFFPALFHGLCEKYNVAACWILPSSRHEVIVIPDNGNTDKETLDAMVKDVNETQVAPVDVLADHCYRYDTESCLITF